MRKALNRAAHVLAAAGMLGLARPAVAQTAMPATQPAHGSIVRTSAQGLTWDTEWAAGENRLMEMQVEVALLANPGTFSCALSARHTGDGLELRGFVTNKFVKEQALEIARKHCTVPVIDKLQVNGILEVRIPSSSDAELQQAAEALLAEEYGNAKTDFEVKVAAPGRLVLHGTCKSCEELTQISKKLRALNGCCAVEVHLTVKPLLRAGHMVTLVTTDGSLTVAAPSGPDTPMPRTHVLADSATPLPAPVVTPPAPVLAITQPKPPSLELPPTSIRKEPVPPLASVKPEVPAPFVPAPRPDPLPSVAKKPDLPAPLPPLVSVKPEVPTPVVPAPKLESLPAVVKKPDLPPPLPPLKPDVPPTLTMKANVTPLPPAVQPPPVKPLPPVVAAPMTPSITPVAASLTTPSAPVVVAATLPPVAAPVGSSESTLSNVPAYAKQPVNPGWQTVPAPVDHLPPPATVAKTTPPPGGWPPAYEKHPLVQQVAYATTGVVMFEDDPLPEPAPMLTKEKANLLKQKVTAVCGAKASDVRVVTTADGVFHVHVKSVAPDKNTMLMDSILTRVPEMASRNVILDFEVPK